MSRRPQAAPARSRAAAPSRSLAGGGDPRWTPGRRSAGTASGWRWRISRRTGCACWTRNWRCGQGEIDVVALDGDCLVVCEVKTRRSAGRRVAGGGGGPGQGGQVAATGRGLAGRCRTGGSARCGWTWWRCIVRSAARRWWSTCGGWREWPSAAPVRWRWSGCTATSSTSRQTSPRACRPSAWSACRTPRWWRPVTGSGRPPRTPGARCRCGGSPSTSRRPALPKAGTGFDLAVAAALLAASGQIPGERVAGWVHVGELGLDGRVRGVRGVLPAVVAALGRREPPRGGSRRERGRGPAGARVSRSRPSAAWPTCWRCTAAS